MLPTGGPMKMTQVDINKHKKDNPGFMFYQSQDELTITEWCSHCEGEVEIKNIPEKQICPECGESIYPCSLCDHNNVKCANCILVNY